MSQLKCKLGMHNYIPIKRKFIEHGSKDCTVGNIIDWQPTYVFKTTVKCIECGKKTKSIGETLVMFSKEQPYDKNYPK